jgi:hypothetical protein
MTKTKTIFTTTLALLFFAVAPFSVLAEIEINELEKNYLPDIENLTGTAIAEGVALDWDAIEGADSYTIYYGTESITEDNADYENQIYTEDVINYEITGLTPDVEYFFAVGAEDSTGGNFGSYNYSNEIVLIPLVAIEDEETDLLLEENSVNSVNEEEGVLNENDESEFLPEENAEIENEPEPEPEPEMFFEAEIDDVSDVEHSASVNREDAVYLEGLPQTGPGVVLALAGAAAGTYFWRRRKN